MTRLRVLHQFQSGSGADAELIELTQGTRKEEGCLEAEAYRNFEHADRLAIVELWEDQYVYGAYWERRLQAIGDAAAPRSSALFDNEPAQSEFYSLQYFRRPDRVWEAADHADKPTKIAWPAGDGVRIISQSGASNLEEWLPTGLANARETRREPGCIQFDHLGSLEFATHALLLELWSPNQAIYDAHWQLRIKTNAAMAGVRRVSTERIHGASGIEFYRYQRFTHLYDRWLPAELERWSETVIWPD